MIQELDEMQAPSSPGSTAQTTVIAAHSGHLIRFGLVGISGVLVNMGLLSLLVEHAHWHVLVAATLATEAAIITNFLLNDHWTFRDSRAHLAWIHRFIRYNAIALGGLVITLSMLRILMSSFGLHYSVANLIAIVAATAWNYTVNARLTWAVSRAVLAHAPHLPHPAEIEMRTPVVVPVSES